MTNSRDFSEVKLGQHLMTNSRDFSEVKLCQHLMTWPNSRDSHSRDSLKSSLATLNDIAKFS